MRNAFLWLVAFSGLVSVLAAAEPAWAADLAYPGPPERRAVRRVIVAPSTLVPDCHERFDAALLGCQPHEEISEADSYAVTLKRRSFLSYPRRPYPQLFSWDYP